MNTKPIVDLLREKKNQLLHTVQLIETGCDEPYIIKPVSNQVKKMDKRIKNLEEYND